MSNGSCSGHTARSRAVLSLHADELTHDQSVHMYDSFGARFSRKLLYADWNILESVHPGDPQNLQH
jgi:hypothetical protein